MSEEGQPTSSPPPEPGLASLEDFKKLTFRVGVVVEAADHPNADRLLVLKVDLGDGAARQVVAGIKGSYAAADLLGKRVVVVANLKSATLRGVESQGMVLAASDGASIVVLSLERPIPAGTPVR